MKQLLVKFEGDEERVGFMLGDGRIVEVKNIAPNPKAGFVVSGDDLLKYEKTAIATWHTHPGHTNNLSVHDYHTFLAWPHLRHYIIGTNGLKEYYVEKGEVYVA